MGTKITIDTDPGVDDALAILFAAQANLPVSAITTVYGNSTIDNVTSNAGYIVKNLKKDWQIYKGAENPVKGKMRLAKSHGDTGLGAINATNEQIIPPSPQSANDYLLTIDDKNDKHTLFCLGPLTNIARALDENSNILKKFNKIIVMAGAFTEKGNVTEFAEFNVFNDPLAASKVFNVAFYNQVDITIIPAEICRQVVLKPQDLEKIAARNLLPNLKLIVKPFIEYYMNNKTYGGYSGAVLYDVLVPLYYMHASLFHTEKGNVAVETADTEQRGRTTFTKDESSCLKLCVNVDSDTAKQVVMDVLMSSHIS